MGGVFIDSFNQTQTLTDKWDFPGNGIISTTVARTGTQSCQIIGGTSGPVKNIGPQQSSVQYTKLVQGVALRADGFTVPQSFTIYFAIVAPGILTQNIIVAINNDGSLTVLRGPGDGAQTTLGTTAPGLFQFGTGWNYIQAKVFNDPVSGSVEIRFAPPTGPMSQVMLLTGLKTVAISVLPYTNQVQLLAAAGITFNCFFADYYCLDWSTPPPNNDFLGGLKIYATFPFANGAPIQLTPLSGTNFQMVDENPPDGDASYNFGGTVGFIDQYLHNPAAIVPANSQISILQHIMDMRVDAGAHSIASVVGGNLWPNVPGSQFLSSSYGMSEWIYDQPPGQSRPWRFSDFPLGFGPQVMS